MKHLRRIPWWVVLFACGTLGLAPFSPPHVIDKLGMLADGTLTRGLDIFDLFFHGAPWVLLILRGISEVVPSNDSPSPYARTVLIVGAVGAASCVAWALLW